jgi:hypothetical protein
VTVGNRRLSLRESLYCAYFRGAKSDRRQVRCLVDQTDRTDPTDPSDSASGGRRF